MRGSARRREEIFEATYRLLIESGRGMTILRMSYLSATKTAALLTPVRGAGNSQI